MSTDLGPLRSLLFVPATRRDRFEKALLSGADAVIFDLEDGVEAGRKVDARGVLADFFDRLPPPEPAVTRLIRVNAPRSPWFLADLELVRGLRGVAGVVLPKCESADDVLVAAEAAPGGRVLPLLETARGVLQALPIASASASMPAVIIGAEDLTAELGVARTVDGEELIWPRSQVALAAAAVGAAAIDAVFVHLRAPEDLARDAVRARALGFTGKMAIHPDQVPIINTVFTPLADEIAGAERVVAAYEAAAAAGEGVVRVDDRMVDLPVVLRARRVLARAAAIKSTP
jgi:citrate lyase beta subunit